MRLVETISKDNGRAIDFIEISMRHDFKEAVTKLREKWNIDADSISENTDYSIKEWLKFLEDDNLRKDVRELIINLKLSSSWEDVIHQYVVDGSLYPYSDTSSQVTSNSEGLILETNPDDINDIILRVGPETVFSDFKTAWDKIKKYRKVFTPRKREKKKFLIQYEIFRLSQDNKSIIEIYRIIKEKYKQEVDLGNIKKIISYFNKQLKIPKQKRNKIVTSKKN